MITTETENVWTLPEVADAQLVLVRAQLDADARGKPPAPFAAFLYEMDHLAESVFWRKHPDGIRNEQRVYPMSLLDVGCGVGHYGVLCARHCPEIRYCGTDVSAEMIAQAKELLHKYDVLASLSVCAWDENPFDSFDVILLSQVLETTDDPPAALEFVLSRAKKFVLLHRLRVSGVPGRVHEPTYCNYPAQNWVWDRDALRALIARYGKVLGAKREHEWDGMLTMIVEKP